MKKREQARDEMVKDVDGKTLQDDVEVGRRWTVYFEQVLNVEDVREVNLNVICDMQMPVLGELNERVISIEKVMEAVNEIKLF